MSEPGTLPARVLERCRALRLPPGARLAVAVSGGLDSVVLLDLLCALRPALGIGLLVATVDHGLRPGSSARDAAFVRALARERGLPCCCARFEAPRGRGPEEAARRERMAFLRALPAARVALAQHRDDQAETVLLRLLRAASLEALCGMAPDDGFLVRPLLGEPRAVLRAWAEARGLAWREDESNARPDFERNRVRHEVLPALERVHGGAGARLASLAVQLERERCALDGATEAALATLRRSGALDRAGLLALPSEALQLRVLRAFALGAMGQREGLGQRGSDQALALARSGRPGARVPLPGGWCLAVCPRALYCLPPQPEQLALRLPLPRRWGVWDLAFEGSLPEPEPLRVRPPRPGERWGGVPVGEILRRAGVPAPLRPYHPVFLLGARPRWLPPLTPEHRCSPPLGLAIGIRASIGYGADAGRPWSAEL